MVFISHFDKDHVSGIRRLHKRLRPRAYVIPQVPRLERVFLAASITVRTRRPPTGEHADLLEDPRRWFAGLPGTPRVIEVLPANGEGETEPAELDPLGVPDTFTDPVLLIAQGGPTPSGAVLATVGPRRRAGDNMSAEADLWICVGATMPGSDSDLQAFANDLRSRLGPSVDRMPIRELVREHWNDLKAAYHAGNAQSRNRTSLCIYSGPPADVQYHFFHSSSHRRNPGRYGAVTVPAPGWLGAGDCDLSDPAKVREFVQLFNPVLQHVGVFAVPHHGAARSLDGSLLGAFAEVPAPGPTCVVGARSTNAHHPSKALRSMLAGPPARLVVASEDPDSRWVVKSTVEACTTTCPWRTVY